MRRREFIIATSLTVTGLTIGLAADNVSASEELVPAKVSAKPARFTINFPQGGCTESSVVSFDRGPFGKDPFGIYG